MSNDSSSATPDPEKPQAGQSTVTWKPWLGLFFVISTYYLSQVAGGILVSIYPWLRHWPHARALDWLDNSVGAQFIFILLAEAFTLGALYLFLKHYKAGFASIGLKRPRWSDPLYGLAAVVPYVILYLLTVAIVIHLVPSLNVNEQQQTGFNNAHGSLQLAIAFISLVVLPPLVEEIMVRGFLYSTLKKALPTVAAVLVTSALFASAHLPEGGAAGPLYIAALDTFVLSLVLIYLREKTGSLWASITLHALKNGFAFVLLFVFHAR